MLVSKESIEVKIEGAVKEPGWYDIPKGSLVIEATARDVKLSLKSIQR